MDKMKDFEKRLPPGFGFMVTIERTVSYTYWQGQAVGEKVEDLAHEAMRQQRIREVEDRPTYEVVPRLVVKLRAPHADEAETKTFTYSEPDQQKVVEFAVEFATEDGEPEVEGEDEDEDSDEYEDDPPLPTLY